MTGWTQLLGSQWDCGFHTEVLVKCHGQAYFSSSRAIRMLSSDSLGALSRASLCNLEPSNKHTDSNPGVSKLIHEGLSGCRLLSNPSIVNTDQSNQELLWNRLEPR